MFKVTGVSRCKGLYKVRFANDMTRIKVLMKTGNDNIELVEMPNAADKAGCVSYLKTTNLYNRAEFKEAIDTADAKYNSIPTVISSTKSPAKVKSDKPSLEAIKARAIKPEVLKFEPEESSIA
jgi:hypothetical protein